MLFRGEDRSGSRGALQGRGKSEFARANLASSKELRYPPTLSYRSILAARTFFCPALSCCCCLSRKLNSVPEAMRSREPRLRASIFSCDCMCIENLRRDTNQNRNRGAQLSTQGAQKSSQETNLAWCCSISMSALSRGLMGHRLSCACLRPDSSSMLGLLAWISPGRTMTPEVDR